MLQPLYGVIIQLTVKKLVQHLPENRLPADQIKQGHAAFYALTVHAPMGHVAVKKRFGQDKQISGQDRIVPVGEGFFPIPEQVKPISHILRGLAPKLGEKIAAYKIAGIPFIERIERSGLSTVVRAVKAIQSIASVPQFIDLEGAGKISVPVYKGIERDLFIVLHTKAVAVCPVSPVRPDLP